MKLPLLRVVRVVGVVVIVTHVSVLLCLVIAGKSTTEIRFITVTYFVAVIIVNHLSSYRFDFFVIGAAVIATIIEAVSGESE